MTQEEVLDPKGLIKEAYQIDGITIPECRSIFLDWALSYHGVSAKGISGLLDRHGHEPEDHPMTVILREGMQIPNAPRRRGGRRARVEQND